MSECSYCLGFDLMDEVSQLMGIPLLLINEEGLPVYRSRYYFKAELEGGASRALRKKLAYVGTTVPQGNWSFATVNHMEAIIVPVHGFGNRMYLVAGYFIKPQHAEKVIDTFGKQLGRELMDNNLLPNWEKCKTQIAKLISLVAHSTGRHEFIENLIQVGRALELDVNHKGEFFWQQLFSALVQTFGLSWIGVILFSSEKSQGYVWEDEGYVRKLNSFSCPLAHWVRESGQPSLIEDLSVDSRGDELLAIRPELRRIVSIPFDMGSGNGGVLHLAVSDYFCDLDMQLIKEIGRVLEKTSNRSFDKNTNYQKTLDSTCNLILQLLSAPEPKGDVYALLLSAVVKALQCQSAVLFLIEASHGFTVKASMGAEKGDCQADAARLNILYGTQPVSSILPPGPQGGGYWEFPVGTDSQLVGMFILRGCQGIAEREINFMRYVTGLLSFWREKEVARCKQVTLEGDVVTGLLSMLQAHVPWLKDHAMRTAVFARWLAYANGYEEAEAEQVYQAALLHSVGKIKTPAALLEKVSQITLAEREAMLGYAVASSEILDTIPTLAHLSGIVVQVEENVDGSGYPQGCVEEQIHDHALIIRIAAEFASMMMPRPFRDPLSPMDALNSLEKKSNAEVSERYLLLFRKNFSWAHLQDEGPLSANKKRKNENLTRRELEVLSMVAGGKNNADIAAALFISEKTVKIHVSNILKKLNVKDRTQAAIYFLT